MKCPSCGSYIKENIRGAFKFKCNSKVLLTKGRKGSFEQSTKCRSITTNNHHAMLKEAHEKVNKESKIGDSGVVKWLPPTL